MESQTIGPQEMLELTPLALLTVVAAMLDVWASVAIILSRTTWDYKALWLVIVFLMPILGAGMYFAGKSTSITDNHPRSY